MAPVTKETPRQQDHGGSQRAEQELRDAVELRVLKSQREEDLHWIAKELGKGLED